MESSLILAILGGCLAVMVLFALVVRLSFRLTAPRLRLGAQTPELIDTPPALVNLLANGLHSAPQAAAAVLLDLVARGWLEIHQPDADPTQAVVHIRRPGHAGLEPYEMRVLDLVQQAGLAAPPTLAALSHQHATDGQRWHDRLVEEVRRDAQARGMIRISTGLSTGIVFTMFVAALLIGCLAGPLASLLIPNLGDLPDWAQGGVGVAFLGVWALASPFLMMAIAGDMPDTRLTGLGRRVSDHWGRVAAWLRAHESFGQLPPSAVAVWDRYLAYGVALDAAPIATAALDLGTGRVAVLGSNYRGIWRPLGVSYPREGGLRGAPAGFRLLVSVASLLGWYGVWLVLARPVADLPAYVGYPLAAVGALLALNSAYRTVRALGDLVASRRMTGQVLRITPTGTFGDAVSNDRLLRVYRSPVVRFLLRSMGTPHRAEDGHSLIPGYHVVIDDGHGDVLRAWRLRTRLAEQIRVGDVLRVRVQRWSRHVVAVAPAHASAAHPARVTG
ncbi:MAG TPA: hypothetical protein VK453_03815 [Micromonosporaceae bacterium]|nr:hypothetical protein [Micromonosporaceae bacterium]